MIVSYRSLYLFLFCALLGTAYGFLGWWHAVTFFAGYLLRSLWPWFMNADMRKFKAKVYPYAEGPQ